MTFFSSLTLLLLASTSLFLFCDVSEASSAVAETRAIVVVSIETPQSPRPWTPFVFDRIKAYADRIGAEFHIERQLPDVCHGVGVEFQRICGMMAKLLAMKRGLEKYDRLLLIDDTCLVR